uniref:Uncharacterized protein n=1 Tax=Candidatus Kentrum sp. FW TaxID=2126338 RepID=A0A450T2X1_9GAMM|nr:MAG: hypothetical protein BECKFW1821B_GA0114236_106011 [Candidatus Kentron sp. FW]
MDKKQKDEIIEELWKIKEQFSSSYNKNIRQITQFVNDIAKEQGFDKTVDNKVSNIA